MQIILFAVAVVIAFLFGVRVGAQYMLRYSESALKDCISKIKQIKESPSDPT